MFLTLMFFDKNVSLQGRHFELCNHEALSPGLSWRELGIQARLTARWPKDKIVEGRRLMFVQQIHFDSELVHMIFILHVFKL